MADQPMLTETGPPIPTWALGRAHAVEWWQFHVERPEVAAKLATMAMTWKNRGHRKCSIGMLFEVVRWNTGIGDPDGDYQLNNNYRALYARHLMRRHPSLDGLFELREQAHTTGTLHDQ